MDESVLNKLKILAESAKYDVSCASSGTSRGHKAGAIGSAAGWGICHSFAEDGRCISLLKIMLINYCMFDCAYCINRRSNDIPRATLTVTELVNLTVEFYHRNYIEGLFLSSRKIWISQQDWKSYQAERRVPLRSKTEKEHATTNNDKRRVSETGEPGD